MNYAWQLEFLLTSPGCSIRKTVKRKWGSPGIQSQRWMYSRCTWDANVTFYWQDKRGCYWSCRSLRSCPDAEKASACLSISSKSWWLRRNKRFSHQVKINYSSVEVWYKRFSLYISFLTWISGTSFTSAQKSAMLFSPTNALRDFTLKQTAVSVKLLHLHSSALKKGGSKYSPMHCSRPSVLICFLLEAFKTNLEQNNDPSSHRSIAWICNECQSQPRMWENADRRGGVHSFYFSNAALVEELILCQGNSGVGADASWRVIPLLVKSIPSSLQPPVKLSMLLPVQWTVPRRFIRTVSAPARSPAALRLSAVGSPGSEGLTRLGELARVSCTHGGRRYGQGGGHGDGPRLRPYQWEHPGHQSGDHRVLQVSPLRCWCCWVRVRLRGAPRALLGAFCWQKTVQFVTLWC